MWWAEGRSYTEAQTVVERVHPRKGRACWPVSLAALPVHTAPEGQAIQLAWQTIGAPQLISRAGSLSVIAPAYGDDAMNNSGLCLHVDAQFTSPYAMSCFTALREKGIEFEWSPLDLDSL